MHVYGDLRADEEQTVSSEEAYSARHCTFELPPKSFVKLQLVFSLKVDTSRVLAETDEGQEHMQLYIDPRPPAQGP
jgi:hypothetical protein